MMLSFSIVIVLGLWMQYLHFYSYSRNARALVDQLRSRDEMLADIIKSRPEISTFSVGFPPLLDVLRDPSKSLICLDRVTNCAFYTFLFTFVLTIIVFSCYGS